MLSPTKWLHPLLPGTMLLSQMFTNIVLWEGGRIFGGYFVSNVFVRVMLSMNLNGNK
jgi:hypothetical protein